MKDPFLDQRLYLQDEKILRIINIILKEEMHPRLIDFKVIEQTFQQINLPKIWNYMF